MTSRKAYGNIKAARQQADQATFVINIPSQASCFNITDFSNGTNTWNNGVVPINIYDLLRKSEFYQNYANMYDEFKIDKIKVKLLPTSFVVSTDEQYRNLTVYTAWDRTGLSYEQIVHSITAVNGQRTLNLYTNIGDDITTYSSAESRTVNPNTNTSIVRWLSPKTLQEKTQWLSTSLLRKWYKSYEPEFGRYVGIPLQDGTDADNGFGYSSLNYAGVRDLNNQVITAARLLESPAGKFNPCFLLEDNGIKFKPTLLIGIYPAVTQAQFARHSNMVKFNVETEVVCSFRGLRKAKVV